MPLFGSRKPNIEKLKRDEDIPALSSALRHTDPVVRKASVWALESIGGPRVVASIVAALDDKDVGVRNVAGTALVGIGELAVESLIAALINPDGWVRLEVACALAEIGDPRAGEPLRAASHEGTTTVVGEVTLAQALARWADAPMRELPPELRI